MQVVVSHNDWSLYRKGQLDQKRHREKVKEAVKQNLSDLVAEESIILSDGKKVLKVPIRSLEEYKFRFDAGKRGHVGHGNGNSKVGDVIAKGKNNGTANGAGDEPGTDYYEAEITIEELQELILEDLILPNLKEKKKPEIRTLTYEFRDVRRRGLIGNLDKKRTLLEAMRNTALRGRDAGTLGVHPPPISDEDLRFKTWEQRYKVRSNAVVLAMMDTSGSMGNFEKYIARSFYFWMVRFLRTKYDQVEIVFIAHDTNAREVTEEEFFRKGESGGTRCSSAYELALAIIDTRYPPSEYNVYPFHFSDGDNFPSDNARCLKLVTGLLGKCNAFGYGEIGGSQTISESTLMSIYQRIEDEKLTCVTIKEKSQVYPALKAFFQKCEGPLAG